MSDRGAGAQGHGGAGGVSRRDVLRTGAAVAAGYGLASPAWAAVQREIAQGQWEARFFTADELPTIRMLADMIIPADDHGGSATEAGTIEYMDFVLSENDERSRQQWHDGFVWLDAETWQRTGRRRFVEATEEERGALLDAIAYPRTAPAELRRAVDWFTRVRDLVASGYFSSAAGVADIGYQGGVFTTGWQGAPPEALRELDVGYAEWDRRYGGRR